MSSVPNFDELAPFASYQVEPPGRFPVFYATERDQFGRRDFLCLLSEVECENADEIEGTISMLDQRDSMDHYDLHEQNAMDELDFYPCSEMEYRAAKAELERQLQQVRELFTGTAA
jgi:hypothetical protein